MKKTSFILVLIFGLFLISGCSGDDKPAYSGDSIQMVSYSANNMMSNGNRFLDETVSSYSSITNPIMKGVLKKMVDYTLFPYNSSTGKDFTTRMKDVYWAEDNIIQAYNLQKNYLENSVIGGAGTIGPRTLSRMTSEEIDDGVNVLLDEFAPKLLESVPFVGDILGSVFGSLFGGPSQEDRMEENQEKMMKQLDALGKTMDQMAQENRQNFKVLNIKADQTLKNLEGLKGDISILNTGVEASLLNDMNAVISQYDGFLTTFSEAANTNEARTIVYNYLKVSADYWQNILTFFNTAKSVQNWAVANGQYTADKVWQDPTSWIDKMWFEVRYTMGSYYGTNGYDIGQTHDLDYDNPKKQLIRSLGNIDYLTKMILARFDLNAVLYAGETLKQQNAAFAQNVLSLQDFIDLKQNSENELIKINERHQVYIDGLYYKSDGTYHTLPYTNWPYINVFTFNPEAEAAGSKPNGYRFYTNSTLINEYLKFPEGGSSYAEFTGINDVHNALTTQYNKVMLDYGIIYLARLVALEVKLKSYLQ